MNNPLKILNSFLNNELKFGENTNVDLSTIDENGRVSPYGSLGAIGAKVDTTEERSYSEKGFIEYDSFSVLPAKTQIHLQEPSYTILVKKAMFSSLSDSFSLDYMDEGEKLFYKSIKTLFANKCQVISAYEKLTKASAIVDLTGKMDVDLFGIISGSVDLLSSFLPDNSSISSIKSVTDRIKKLTAYNRPSAYTSWITDDSPFKNVLGAGTGVIELNNVKSFGTNVSLTGDANASMSISDPYNLNIITIADIEKAISDAGNSFYNNQFLATLNNVNNDLIDKNIAEINSLRTSRGVGILQFKTSPSTIFGKRLRIINDRLGIEIPFTTGALDATHIDPAFIVGSNNSSAIGEDGIKGREVYLAEKIIKDIFNKMSYDTVTKSNKTFGPVEGDEDSPINYARKKMMFWFLSKPIIDVNDVVHIFVNSKETVDGKISSLRDNFNRLNITQSIGNSVANVKETFNSIVGIFGAGGTNYDIEKSVFAGPDFPNILWTMLREQFVTEKTGIQIYCGLVTNSRVNFSSGSGYNLEVSITDNKKYLSFGQVNSQPSVDIFNGSINEQLTPFKSKFDSNVFSKDYKPNDLLDENKALLSKNFDQIKIPSGPLAGRPANFDNLFGDIHVDKQGRVNRAMYAPNGFVYRWKEGIGTLTQFGKFDDLADPSRIGTPNIASNPFAGQDVMNTLSLLISGIPYNYATYLKAVRQYDTSTSDPLGNKVPGSSFADKFRTDLRKVNRMYGNFIPFKNFTSNEQTYRNILLKQSIIDGANEKINEITSEIASLSAQLRVAGEGTAETAEIAILKDRLSTLSNDANNILIESATKANDIVQQDQSSVFDITDVSSLDPLNDDESKKNLKRKVGFLTRRLSYNVRANEDKNYLIVDDSYDKDYDIASFENKISGSIQLFNSEYMTPREKVDSVAALLELECFANSQGHIVIRPPQYNKIPSSVFYRMLELKEKTGLRIFPKFLEDLFGLQIETVSSKVEILEDKIRVICSFLNTVYYTITDDDETTSFIRSNTTITSSTKRNDFQFLTDQNGVLTNINNIRNVRSIRDLKSNTGFKDIQNQTYTANQLGAQSRLKIVSFLTGSKNPIAPQPTNGTYGGKAIERLRNRGENFQPEEFNNTIGQGTVKTYLLDVNKVLSTLDSLLKEREKMVSILHYSLKNLVEANTIDSKDAEDVLPLFTPNKYIPEMYSGLIEDESYDDLGPGSGKRYILTDDKIKNFSISYKEPEFTVITVTGILGDFVGVGSQIGANFDAGGNAQVSATCIDFDMWRRFGSRKTSSINVPFFTNPETQCAPYAVSLLNRVRKSLITASAEVIGNEYYQAGDVVFVESYNKLFYVDSVSHSYTEGSSFSTTLSLTYGHAPGEYIPTILDIVGKLLIKNRDNQNFINFRQQQNDSYKPYGVFILDRNSSSNLLNIGTDTSNASGFTKNNSQLITDLLFDAALMIDKYKTSNTQMRAVVEIRAYGQEGGSEDYSTRIAADSLKELLSQGFNNAPPIDSSDIEVVSVLLGPNESRSPSQKAMSITHDFYLNNRTPNLLDHLYTSVLDVFIRFEEI